MNDEQKIGAVDATDANRWLVTVSFLFAVPVVGGKQAIEEMQREVRRIAEKHGTKITGGSTKWSAMDDPTSSEKEDR